MDQKNNPQIVKTDLLETPNGVEDFVWSEKNQLLITAGGQCTGQLTRNKAGLCGWAYETRNGELAGLVEKFQISNSGESIYQRVKSGLLLAYDPSAVSGSRLVALSSDESKLALAELDGTISIWKTSDLSQIHQFTIDAQPGSGDVPRDAKDARTLSAHYSDVSSSQPTKLSWWNGSLVVTRLSGSISIYSMANSTLQIAADTEWASPGPVTSLASDNYMFGLEQTLKSSQTKDFFEIDDQEKSLVSRSLGMLQWALYYLTEMERLNPLSGESQAVKIKREYKLFQLQRTTPAQLYLRLIDNGEYGRALEIADEYGLDTDLVYQKRWESSDFGRHAVDDFLRKITKRSYINEQIQYQLPETLDACRELIKFGLKGNGLAALRELATTSPDDLGFIVFDEDEDDNEEEYTGFDPVEKSKFDRKKLLELNEKLIAQIDFKNLNTAQLNLLKTRLTLLRYLDRLNTFEELNGGYGSEKARRNFQASEYECFREQELVEYAAECARAADWRTGTNFCSIYRVPINYC